MRSAVPMLLSTLETLMSGLDCALAVAIHEGRAEESAVLLDLVMHRRCCLQHFLLTVPLFWLARLVSSRSSSTLLLRWDVPPLGA